MYFYIEGTVDASQCRRIWLEITLQKEKGKSESFSQLQLL